MKNIIDSNINNIPFISDKGKIPFTLSDLFEWLTDFSKTPKYINECRLQGGTWGYYNAFTISSNGQYLLIGYSSDEIQIYEMNTPWMLSTLNTNPISAINKGDDGISYYVANNGIYINDTGNKIIESPANGIVREFEASSAYDWSSFSQVDNKTPFSGGYGITVKPDGKKMYRPAGTSVEVVTLGTAFDLSSQESSEFISDILPSGDTYNQIIFSQNGLKMYAKLHWDKAVIEFNLSEAFNLTTSVQTENTIDIDYDYYTSINFSYNGKYLYYNKGAGDIYQYEF